MSEFNAILLEGVFYLSDTPCPDMNGVVCEGFNHLLVHQHDGTTPSVYDALKPFIGERVRVSMHHLPQMPINPTRWGAGSCLWEGTGVDCPFGHAKDPSRLFNIAEEGVLAFDLDHTKNSGGWWLETFEGRRIPLLMAYALGGHQGRVAVATAMSVEQMRESLEKSGGLDSVEALGSKVTDLRDLLSRLGKAVSED